MVVFESQGQQNTIETLRIAFEAARARGIKDIVIASTTGATAEALDQFDLTGLHIVIVTHSYGYAGNGLNKISRETREIYRQKGYDVVTASHTLTGVERSLSSSKGGIYPGEIIAETLKMFSRGTKVVVEIAAMAADNGVIQPAVPIIAVAGSAKGADTAVIMRGAHSHRIMETRIDEYLCKPIANLTVQQ